MAKDNQNAWQGTKPKPMPSAPPPVDDQPPDEDQVDTSDIDKLEEESVKVSEVEINLREQVALLQKTIAKLRKSDKSLVGTLSLAAEQLESLVEQADEKITDGTRYMQTAQGLLVKKVIPYVNDGLSQLAKIAAKQKK